MKKKRKKSTILIIGLVITIISVPYFLEQSFAIRVYNNDKLIQKEEDHFTYNNSKGGSIDLSLEKDFEFFNGLDTDFILNISSDTEIEIVFSENITSGKFKAVLVSHDGILETLSIGENNIKCTTGKYRIRVVGVEAYGNYEISIMPNVHVSIEHI